MAKLNLPAILGVLFSAHLAFAGSQTDSAIPFSASNTPTADLRVKAFLPNRPAIFLPQTSTGFQSGSELSKDQIDQLEAYIKSQSELLRSGAELSLRLVSQSVVGKNTFVRFQQGVQRSIRKKNYFVPIVGSTIVAKISEGRLATLNSALVAQADIVFSTQHPGFRFDFSDSEMAVFVHSIKSSEAARTEAKTFFGDIARRANLSFDLDQFLNRDLEEQKILMNRFFGSLGARYTARTLVQLAMRDQVALVKYGEKWMFQLTGIMNLPLQFDVVVPESPTGRLIVVNLREIRTKATSVRGFESPHFPGGKKVEGGPHAERASNRFRQISQYFADRFGWTSFKGKDIEAEIHVHTQLKSVDFRENASWVGSMQKFIVGEGGARLHELDDSISVLGHEYAHAILQFSSGLAYRGQSGALNEHFADIQGASIAASVMGGGKFSFTIGEEVLTPQVKAEKSKLLELILTNQQYSSYDITRYGLQQIGLRHLFAPMLSFATQYDHMTELRKVYSEDCQPSVDNDNCGVHSASGIPNKAAAMIIGLLGVEDTRSLFFNTAVYRLNQSSNFTDYLVQLLEECRETPKIASKCDVIISSFSAVGVRVPSHLYVATPPAPISEPVSATPQGIVALATQAASPSLKLCGWVDRVNDDRIRIFDDKYNGTILKLNYDVKTTGEYSALEQMDCACVRGQLTQSTNARGEVFTAFLNVEDVEDRGQECALDPALKDKLPSPIPENIDSKLDPEKAHDFCGWISVNSKSRNVTIIDNRYDVALLASGYANLTKGNYSDVYKHQCACVNGKIDQTENSEGTKFNYMKSVEGRGVVYRAPESCVGIQWK